MLAIFFETPRTIRILINPDNHDHLHLHQVVEEEVLAGLEGEEAPVRMKQEPCMNNLQVLFVGVRKWRRGEYLTNTSDV